MHENTFDHILKILVYIYLHPKFQLSQMSFKFGIKFILMTFFVIEQKVITHFEINYFIRIFTTFDLFLSFPYFFSLLSQISFVYLIIIIFV